MGNSSEKGLRESAGMMVNYLYDLPAVEELHERFANRGAIPIGKPVRQLMTKLESHSKSMEFQG
jgi:malonyl-CoA decarboxylase